MKRFSTILSSALLITSAYSETTPEDRFYEGLQKVEAQYRSEISSTIRSANKVEVFLVKFDDLLSDDGFADTENSISTGPSKQRAKTLSSVEVTGSNRASLLSLLADQISVPKHSGGAFCHFPVHGVRIYKDDTLIHEGTFCWICSNFSFSYPQGSSWLDTTPDLKKLFISILPIPQSEIDRFNKKYAKENNKPPQN